MSHNAAGVYYLSEPVALLRRALRLAGGVTQCKDDRLLVEGSHVFDDLLRKRSCDCCHSFMFRKKTRKRIHQFYNRNDLRFTEMAVLNQATMALLLVDF